MDWDLLSENMPLFWGSLLFNNSCRISFVISWRSFKIQSCVVHHYEQIHSHQNVQIVVCNPKSTFVAWANSLVCLFPDITTDLTMKHISDSAALTWWGNDMTSTAINNRKLKVRIDLCTCVLKIPLFVHCILFCHFCFQYAGC